MADGSIGSSKIPQEFKPTTAITTTDEIQKKVALFDIPQNTVIVKDMFVDPASTQISFRARLKDPEQQAVSVSVDSVRAVGGFLVPGDEVNIMVFNTVEARRAAATRPTSGRSRWVATCLRWLATSSKRSTSWRSVTSPSCRPGSRSARLPADATTDTGNSGVLTFNVPPSAVQWLASAQQGGGMYLSLVAEDYSPRELPPLDSNATLLPGEDPAQLTPYGPGGAQK